MRNAVFLLDQLNHRRPTPQRKVHLQLFGALVADRSANRLFLFGAQASALTGQADPIMAMGYQLLIGAAPLALLSMLTEDVSLLMWSPEFVLVLMALAGLGSSLAFWLWFEVLERVTLNLANAFHVSGAGLRADDWRGLLRRAARGNPGRRCRPGADRYLAGAAARRCIPDGASGNEYGIG